MRVDMHKGCVVPLVYGLLTAWIKYLKQEDKNRGCFFVSPVIHSTHSNANPPFQPTLLLEPYAPPPLVIQHDQMAGILSTEYKTPAGGVVNPWDSYSEVWSALTNVPEAVRDLVEEQLPTLDALVSMAKDKDFATELKGAQMPGLLARRIAKFVQSSVYVTE